MIATTIYIFLAALSLLLWLIPILDAAFARWHPLYIRDIPAEGPESLPRLSVIVPALNEEGTIAPAMQSLLAIDYPDLEIIAVDDRSTDQTGRILDDLARNNSRLHVIHVTELPPDWLGKAHALHVGSQHATGDYLLLTDADVQFERLTLRKAVRYCVSHRLDHLVVLPEMIVEGFWETLMVWFFSVLYYFKFRPWKVADPQSTAHVGIGAFNLVRTDLYRRLGGHAAVRMDIIEDVKLGKVMKAAGGRAAVAFGRGAVRVRWVEGLSGIVNGVEKNAFTAYSYRAFSLMSALLAIVLLAIWPTIGLFAGPVSARVLCAVIILVVLVRSRKMCPRPGASTLYPLLFPLAAMVMGYCFIRSMVLAYRRGGVVWRGTLYPLAELRRWLV